MADTSLREKKSDYDRRVTRRCASKLSAAYVARRELNGYAKSRRKNFLRGRTKTARKRESIVPCIYTRTFCHDDSEKERLR